MWSVGLCLAASLGVAAQAQEVNQEQLTRSIEKLVATQQPALSKYQEAMAAIKTPQTPLIMQALQELVTYNVN